MQYNIKLFVIYHTQEKLDCIPNLVHYQKINISELPIKYNSNLIGEGRFFLSQHNTNNAEYIGVVNARWNSKYTKIATKMEQLSAFASEAMTTGRLSRYNIIGPWTTDCKWLNVRNDWYDYTMRLHPSMRRLLSELQEFTGMKLQTGRRSLWANDFICHRIVYYDFIRHWRRCFQYFHGKYGYLLPFSTYGIDTARYAAYFYERCSTIFWSNYTGITITGIP